MPSISHLDLDNVHMEKGDRQRFPTMSGMNISTAPPGSPSTAYSGPPYSYSSTAGSTQNPSGYISPPESTRRSIRDEKDSPGGRKSLPSIHEALGEKTMPYGTPTALSHSSVSAPPSAHAQSFPDAPKGPPNPFSQSIPPTAAIQTSQSYQAPPEAEQPKPSFMAINNVEPRPPLSQVFGPVQSPRFPPGPSHTSGHHSFSDSYVSHDAAPLRSPSGFGVTRSPITFQHGNPPPPAFPYSGDPFLATKTEDQRFSSVRNGPGAPYGDSVKRHLDVYDVELALNEVR